MKELISAILRKSEDGIKGQYKLVISSACAKCGAEASEEHYYGNVSENGPDEKQAQSMETNRMMFVDRLMRLGWKVVDVCHKVLQANGVPSETKGKAMHCGWCARNIIRKP